MKKILLCISFFCIVTGLGFAAGQQEKTSSQVFEVAVFSTEDEQIALYKKFFQQSIDEFNKKEQTNYTLKLVSGQKMDILNTRMNSKNKPDLFLIDSPADVQQYAKNNLLLDLSEYAKTYAWQTKMFDWAYSLSKVNGKVMTLPYGYEGMVIWYNKKIMNELGLQADSINSLEKFQQALEKAKAAKYIPIMLGSQDWPWAQEWYLSIMFSYTGRNQLKNTIEGKQGFSWTDKAFSDTVALYKSWNDKGYLADGKSYTLTSDDAINAFVQDRALFKLEGTWAPYWIVPLSKEDQDKIGVMLHPSINTVENPHMPLAVGAMWCLSAETQYKDLGGYIMNNLLEEKFQADFIKAGMDVAPIKLNGSQFKGLVPVVEQMWNLVNNALANGQFGYTTWAFYPPETRVYLYEGIVNVMEGKITINQYLTEMQKLNQKELQQGFIPVIPTSK